MKRVTAFILSLALLILPVLASGEDSSASPDEFVAEIMDSYSFRDGNYAIAFRSMYDGETWLCNAGEYFKVASVYKLPLNMYFYEMETAGEIEPDAIVGGVRLDLAHYYSLEFSNNEISEAMLDYLGGYAQYKTDILKYIGGAADDVTDEYYYDNAFTAEMLLNILDYLYSHSQDFEGQLEHMLAAQPGEYLESGELDCEIAQKYGSQSYDGVLHVAVAGIVYADEPFLITVLTRSTYGAAEAMGRLCDAFAAWDAQRIASIEESKLEVPPASPTPNTDDGEAEELKQSAHEAVLSAIRAVCAAAPLPERLPWEIIFQKASA